MYQDRKKLGFELLVSKLRSNFGRLILVNLLFSLPLAVSLMVAWLMYVYVIKILVIALPLAVVLMSPFYSGVVVLAREYSKENNNVKIFSTYIKAVKDNWLPFLLWGVVMYLGIVGSCFGFKLYASMAQSFGWIFYVVMFFLLIMSLFLLFLSFAVPLMTASFELKQKDVYKNSALMTFGEIKNNFFAALGIVAFVAIALLPFVLVSYLSSLMPLLLVKILLIGCLAIAVFILIPAPSALIISHYIYPNMHAVITGVEISKGNTSNPASDSEQSEFSAVHNNNSEDDPGFDLEELRNGDGEEYIFYQGKMIKRKLLLNILEQKEEGNNND